MRALHIGIIHLDTKTYLEATRDEDHDKFCGDAVDKYFAKTEKLFGMKGQILLQCRDNSKKYFSLDDLWIGSNANE